MKDKLTAFLLAVLMVAQVIAPQAAWASGNNFNPEKKQDLVKIGELDTKSYPKLDNKTILAIQKQAREKQKAQKRKPGAGFFSADNPYLPGQNPTDEEKAAAYGRIRVIFETEGLNDNGTVKAFQWKEIFGEDSNGNLTNAKIHFIQRDAKTNTELGRYTLNVNQAGEYKWTDELGKEALLPLYSNTLEPYRYEASLEYQISDKVKLLAMEIGTTDEKTTFTKEGDKNVADIPLKLKLGQVASTKFESEWKTSLDENSRPQVEGLFNTKNKDEDGFDIENLIAFPKNNTDSIKLRNDNVDPNNPPDLPYDQSPGLSFRNVPEVSIVEGLDYSEDPLNGTPTYNFDEANKTITTLDGKHKFKYDFNYDVINGGKLTMTEILPVTFDANGGKFDSLDATAEQKIVKEVDYENDLTDMPKNPTKDRETFKGWSLSKDGPLVTDADFAKIKSAKTFYAIWDNNEITAEELTVHESFKDGDTWVNNFIPTLEQLKGQVKIKDGNGVLQPLKDDDTFAIVDGTNEYTTDDAAKDYLYNLLKEDDGTEVSRKVTLKAKVTVNGTSQTVDIPIKVIKNIYEAKTLTEKPFYVPADYVKVTLDPTTKAQEPQKTYYYVNKDAQVVIPGKDPVGTDGNNFVNWTMKPDSAAPDAKGDVYTLADRNKFTEASTITANYVGNVVEQKGKDKPKVPDDFVKVIVDTTDQASDATRFTRTFWVKPKTPVRIEVKDPVAANKEKAFNRWKKEDEPNRFFNINLNDKQEFRKEVTRIQAFYSDLAIEQKEGQPKPDTVPDNFIRIYLDTTDKATVKKRSTWWVAPDKSSIKIVLDSPVGKEVTKGNSSYKWQFNDRWKSESNEVKATSSSGTKKIYEINTTKVSPEEIFYAQYTTDNVIPKFNDDGSENDKPDGYVTLTFDKGDHGKEITGQTVYYVNPKASPAKTLGNDSIKKPEVKAKTGWKQKAGADAWDTLDTFEIKTDKTVKAQYEAITDVIPQGKEDGSDKPDGYITVTFSTETNGKIEGSTKTTKVVYVNPNKAVVLKDEAPEVTPNAGFEFTGWDTQIEKAIQYKDNDVIKAKYKTIADVVPQEGENKPEGVPKNFVKVTFVPTEKGTMEGAKIFWVNPEVKVTIPVKDPVGATYFKFDKWKFGEKADGADYTPSVETQFKENTTITATYKEAKNIIPYNPEEPITRPDGYVRVTFAADPGLKLTEQKAYYVKKNAKITLKAIKDDTTNYGYPSVTANTGYKFEKWDKGDDTVINADIVVTAKATKLDNVIPEKDANGKTNEKPTGYVQVTVDPTDEATDPATKVFWVNPNEVVQIPAEKPTGKKEGETTYVFYDWDRSLVGQFTEDTTITATYKKETPQTPIFAPYVSTGVVATDLNKQPPLDAYKDQIKSDKDFELVDIVEQPKVNESGFTSAKIKIRFKERDMTKVVDVLVYVKPDPKIIEKPYPVPGDCNNSCDQPNKPGEPNKPNQPNIGMDALNTTDHYQYLIGYPDGNFAPNRGMTRAEVATMFTRLLKERPVKGQRYYTGFSDIQAGDWYANTVGYAVQVGIVSGYPDGSFKPNKPITRAEFASIASRFDALAQGNDIAFNDLAPSHWGYNAIRSAATKGWISGYPDNTFRPEKAISRAEVTSITNRMLNRYADLYWIDAHRGEVIRFGDVNRGDWYFEPIMEATMGHDFIRDRDGKTEHWTGLNGKSFI